MGSNSTRTGLRKPANVLDEVIQGSAFDTHAPVESFSLLYLNPPYDFEMGEGRNKRMERLFLEHVARWLKPGGVLVFVVPYDRVFDCRGTLTTQFRDKAIYRLTAPESVTYKQVVLFGVRRSRQERERMTDRAVNEGNWKLQQLTRCYDAIPPLPDEPDRQYIVPPAQPARLEYRGLPLDLVEDLLDNSSAWRQAQRITARAEDRVLRAAADPATQGSRRLALHERATEWRLWTG